MDSNKVTEARLYRIYPTEEQQKAINFYIECNRLMWNAMLGKVYTPVTDKLSKKDSLYKTLNRLDYKDQKELAKRLNKIMPKKVYTEIEKLKCADTAMYGYTKKVLKQSFSNHFKNPKHFKMPKFKSFKDTLYQGRYTTAAGNFSYFKSKDIFKLSKVGNIRIINHYFSKGRLFRVSVQRKPDNTYYVSLFFEQENHTKIYPKTDKEVGIDFNVDNDTALALSDKKFVKRPRVKKILPKLDWESHKLGKKRDKLLKSWVKYNNSIEKADKITFSEYLKNSFNYQKLRLKVARINHRIRRIYNYWIKKTTSILVKTYDKIVIEDLKSSNMIKNHHLARALAQSHFRELRTTLEYKALWSSKNVISVDPKYTTQTCSNCGYTLNKENRLTLRDREWICPECGKFHIRDINAAINILNKSKKMVDNLVEV